MKYAITTVFTLLCTQAVVHAQAAPRDVVARFALTIEGQQAGTLNTVTGGTPVGTVVQQALPVGGAPKKHIGGVQYEPITFQVGVPLAPVLQQWIASTLRGEGVTHGGAVIGYDTQRREVQRRNFSFALISKVTFPTLDASNPEPGLVSVVVVPERVEIARGSGAVAAVEQTRQKSFVSSNFRLELDGIDTSRVSKIDSFTIQQKLAPQPMGGVRDPGLEPAAVEIPNLTVTLSAHGLESWQAWFEEFVILGQNGDNREKSGRIVLLAPNLQDVLLELSLSNVGIYAMRQLNPENNDRSIAHFEAKLYVERIELTPK